MSREWDYDNPEEKGGKINSPNRSGCYFGCSGGCDSSCTETCAGNCYGCYSCTGTCLGNCYGCYSCTGTCRGTCFGLSYWTCASRKAQTLGSPAWQKYNLSAFTYKGNIIKSI